MGHSNYVFRWEWDVERQREVRRAYPAGAARSADGLGRWAATRGRTAYDGAARVVMGTRPFELHSPRPLASWPDRMVDGRMPHRCGYVLGTPAERAANELGLATMVLDRCNALGLPVSYVPSAKRPTPVVRETSADVGDRLTPGLVRLSRDRTMELLRMAGTIRMAEVD